MFAESVLQSSVPQILNAAMLALFHWKASDWFETLSHSIVLLMSAQLAKSGPVVSSIVIVALVVDVLLHSSLTV